jgi:hypothetical protein
MNLKALHPESHLNALAGLSRKQKIFSETSTAREKHNN